MIGTALRPLAVAVCLFATACATAPTPYQEAETPSGYGYHEDQIDPETWRVSFAGNAHTSRGQTEDALLYRAAEIASDAQAEGFVMIDETVEPVQRHRGTNYAPRPGYGLLHPFYGPFGFPGFHAFYGFHGGFAIHGGRRFHRHSRLWLAHPIYLRPITTYTASAKIRLYDGATPEIDGVPYKTREVLNTVGPRIVRPDTDSG